jgi:carbon monoxide dehydrogenase subunit G
MASIQRELRVGTPPAQVWDAMSDVGRLHERLVPGFVTDCRLEGDERVVTFANGLTARELLVDIDPARKRVAWSARSERLRHHNASLQAFADGNGTRLVWIADLLPNEMAPAVGAMIDQGIAAMKRAFER